MLAAPARRLKEFNACIGLYADWFLLQAGKMAKHRKQRQQPSKKKVQVKQKIAKQDSTTTSPAKKFKDVKLPEDTKNVRVYGLNNLGNTCFYNSALQVRLSGCRIRHSQAAYLLMLTIEPCLPSVQEKINVRASMCCMCVSVQSV